MTTTLDLGLLRFVFCGNYDASIIYETNNIVRYGGNVYAYVSPIKNSGIAPTDTTYWQKILDGYNYRGAFSMATNYLSGDVVTYGGSTYLATDTSTNKEPTDVSAWVILNVGIRPMGDWAVSTQYLPNDIVIRGNNSYIALAAHISANFPTDLAANKWKKFNGGVRWAGDWVTGSNYITGDILRYSGSSYIAGVDFIAGSTFSSDLAAGKVSLLASGTANPNALTESLLTTSKTVDVTTHYLVSTGRSSVVAKLPANPADGSMIRFTDAGDCGSNPLAILTTDGSKIAGDKFPFNLDVRAASVLFTFNFTTKNWTVK